MNYRIVARTLGTMLIITACCMIPSAIVSLFFKDDISLSAFLLIGFIMATVGISLKTIRKPTAQIRLREGYMIVVLTWFIICFSCAMPYFISGAIPNFFDAIFEATSGVTTTGSSILTDIESLPAAMQFWRGFTHWMGGLGILTMAIAILPTLGIGGFQMAKAEASNSNLDKTAPKMTDMAKILYKTYFILTLACIILLILGGLNLMDACEFSFSAIATGGFAPKNASVGYYDSAYVEAVLSLFMIIGSISFPVIYAAFAKKKLKSFFKNEEVKSFLILILSGCVAVSVILFASGSCNTLAHSLREGFFHTVSIMTTTGFFTTNYDLWPSAALVILMSLTFIGGCSGSTTGGVKVIRALIVVKLIAREFQKKLHPKAVYSIKVKNELTSYDTSITASTYLILLFMLILVGTVVVSFDPASSNLMTAFSASFSSATNLGPGFSMVGPISNFGFLQGWTKLFLSFIMIVGKLEIFAILILFTPSFWNPDKY